jgi:hypothetical protein
LDERWRNVEEEDVRVSTVIFVRSFLLFVLSVSSMMILFVDDDETGGCQVRTEGTDDTALGSRRLLIGQKVAEIRRGGCSSFDGDFCSEFFP